MAGEFILKLLTESNAYLVTGGRSLTVAKVEGALHERYYTVYERKPYAKSAKVLIVTEDERNACEILKGE